MNIENWQDLQPHELANRLPRLPANEQTELNRSVEKNGLRHQIIVISDGNGGWLILDGRNRHEACVVTNTEPDFWPYEGDDPAGFVADSNVHRRHLSMAERKESAKRLLAERPDLTSRAVADHVGIKSHHTVQKLKDEMAERGEDIEGDYKHREQTQPAERITATGKRAPGRRPDTPEVKAAKQARKAAAKAAAKADSERNQISSVREMRIDFVTRWLQEDGEDAVRDIRSILEGFGFTVIRA